MPKVITASHKQRKFAKAFLKTGSLKKAALEAYDVTEKSAYSLGLQTFKSPMTQAYLKRLLDEKGLTDDVIVDYLKNIADAGISEQSLKAAKPSDALNAIEKMIKLKNLYPAEEKKVETKTINYNFDSMSNEQMMQELEKQRKEMESFSKLLKSDIKDIQEAEVVK